MITILSKVKHLTVLAEPLLKSEVIGFNFCNIPQRTLYTKNILLSRSIYKKELNESDPQLPEKESFGKIIELGEDFEDFRVEDTKKRKGKAKKLYENFQEHPSKNVTAKRKEILVEEKEPEDENDLEKSDETKFDFQSLTKNSAILSSVMTSLKSRKIRERKKQIILEGKRLIQDAITAGYKPLKIFFSRVSDLETLNLKEDVLLYKVPYKSLKLWGDVVTSQGVIAVFQMPEILPQANNEPSLPLTVICDNVRDPGNLGSMIRVIAGVGCEKLILTKGCTDVWASKVLRGGAGAHFHLPIISNVEWSDIEQEIKENSNVILADFSNNSLLSKSSENEENAESKLSYFERKSEFSKNLPIHCYYSVKYEYRDTVMIIGGETHGLSDEAYKLASERKGNRIFIPMSNKIESLNNSVALGILVYEFKRQLDFLNGAEIHPSTTVSDS